ncbi:MAG: alpha-amylase family protein [Lentisphaeria bacterium]
MNLKGFFFAGIFLCNCFLSAQTMQPQIRKAFGTPFDAKGKAVQEVWENADILTGFSVPAKACVVIYQSRARILRDDENLYFNIEGDFEPSLEFCPPSGGQPFVQTCIEVLIRPNPASNDFYHIAVAPGSKTYSADGFRSVPMEGLKVWFFKKNSRIRITNLQVPLKSIGLEGADDGKIIGLNICGANFDLVKGTSKQSGSFAVLEKMYFRDPATWPLALFACNPEPGRVIRGHSENLNLNLIANSDFSYALPDNKGVPGWSIPGLGKDTFREEEMAMSNNWLIKAGGKSFWFMRCYGQNLDPEKFYTMRVTARTVNGGNQLGIQQYARVGSQYRKLGVVIDKVSLSDKFASFSFVFKPAAKHVDFLFYRYGDQSEENKSSLEISSVELYKGELASFEIRTVTDLGLKTLAKGTERPIPANPMGKRKESMKVLAFTWSESLLNYMRAREILELFSETGAEVDILCAQNDSSDIFYTKNDSKIIQERLETGNYDLYLLSGDATLKRIGEKTAALICKNVENRAALVLGSPAKLYHFNDFFKQYPPQQVAEDDYLRHAFPNKLAKLQAQTPPPYAMLATASAGKGHIYRVNFAHPQNVYLPRRDVTNVLNPYFPFDDYARAWITRLLYYAAGKTPSPIESIQQQQAGFSVTTKNTPEGTRVRWKIITAVGQLLLSGAAEINANKAEIQYPADKVPSGINLLTVQTLDEEELVLDYSALAFTLPGPELSLTSLCEYYAGQDEGRFALTISGRHEPAKVVWKLKDFSMRILETGTFNAVAEKEFSVPFTHVFTNFNTLSIDLVSEDKILATMETMILVQDRDALRSFTDGFTLRMWGPGATQATEATVREIDYQMGKIGVRIFCPTYTFEGIPSMGSGISVGGIFLGHGDMFCGWPQKSNIRAQQFNTVAAREKIRVRAEGYAQEARKFGYTFGCVCDEPNLSRPGASDELDSHPDNIAEFRKRMQKKYETIAEFNRRMGSNYESFEEVEPVLTAEARETGRFGEFIEWRNFNVDRWCEIIKIQSDALKKYAPHARFALTNSFGQGIYSGNDYAKLYRKAGLDFATEYSSCIYLGKNPIYNFDEFMRSFNPEMLSWGSVGYTSSAKHISFSPWWFACHRYGGMGWYAATGANWNMVDRPTLGLTQDAVLLGKTIESSRLQKGLGKLFLEYRWKKNDIAIYYSQTSMQVSFLLGKETRNGIIDSQGPLHDYFYSRQGIQYALEALLFQYDYLAADQVEDGILEKGYKTLFLPSIVSMSDNEIAAIRKFVAGGGKIIADFAPGIYDELGVKRKQTPLPETKLSGKIFAENTVLERQEVQELLKQTVSQPILKSDGIAEIPGREAMHFTSGTNSVYTIIRNFALSNDNLEQTFIFPKKGHLYDLRSQAYLGETDRVSCRVPNADAVVFGLYPYRIDSLQVTVPAIVNAGTDLQASLAVAISDGTPGRHVFHVELENPAGETPVSLQRNIVALHGQSDFVFRMAANDPKGMWILRVNDLLSGLTSEKQFALQ